MSSTNLIQVGNRDGVINSIPGGNRDGRNNGHPDTYGASGLAEHTANVTSMKTFLQQHNDLVWTDAVLDRMLFNDLLFACRAAGYPAGFGTYMLPATIEERGGVGGGVAG